MKVEVAVLGSPSPIFPTVTADHHCQLYAVVTVWRQFNIELGQIIHAGPFSDLVQIKGLEGRKGGKKERRVEGVHRWEGEVCARRLSVSINHPLSYRSKLFR